MSDTAIEITRKVWDQQEGVALEVGDFGDAPDFIEIRTTDGQSIDWYGKLSITMRPEVARQLGQALLDAARDKLAK